LLFFFCFSTYSKTVSGSASAKLNRKNSSTVWSFCDCWAITFVLQRDDVTIQCYNCAEQCSKVILTCAQKPTSIVSYVCLTDRTKHVIS